MSEQNTLHALVEEVNAGLTDPNRNHIINAGEDQPVRFELYHAGLSVCSQKVRATLAEKDATYKSHELVILNSRGIYSDELTPAENYRPAYVRLRLYAAKKHGLNLVSGYSGSSSVETEGFDACVVPTLVDHEKNEVIVDSVLITQYLEKELSSGEKLIPEDPQLAASVEEQVAIVDQTPQPALLYGFHPDDDQRPEFLKHAMGNVYDLKVEALEQLIEQNSDDSELVNAYRSKIVKETSGKSHAHDNEFQYKVREIAQGIINNLETQLAEHSNPWVCGEHFTMADLVWGVNLYRMHWLGLNSLWKDLPKVNEYASRVYHRPSIWNNVIKFPSPMPESPHTADI